MILRQDFEQRLEELGWTLYQVAKAFAEYRAEGESPASRYHSTISRAIENPATSRLETIAAIVHVLGGELQIVWDAERVISFRLEEETLAALKERANNEAKSVNEIAKDLLLQALSGLVQPSTELVIDLEKQLCRKFHSAIAKAYSNIDEWLINLPDNKGYLHLDFSREIERILGEGDLKSVSFQYFSLFPNNYFRASETIDQVINGGNLKNRIKFNPRIYLLDMGGTMGAATLAFIEKIITLKQDYLEIYSEEKNQSIEIICFAIEPNLYKYAIYQKLMTEIKEILKSLNIKLEFQVINEPLSQGILKGISYFNKQLNESSHSLKTLSDLFIFQLDMAKNEGENWLEKEKKQKLQELGIEVELKTEINQEFWQEEALCLKRLLEEIPVDSEYLITIETKNLVYSLRNYWDINEVKEGIKLIKESLKKIISKHEIRTILEGEQEVYFENPVNSYWQKEQILTHASKFQISVNKITNSELEKDEDWRELITIKNLELAWVRARNNIFKESFYDEVEIKLFEQNLEQNLEILQDNLVVYSAKIFRDKQDTNYQFPKSKTTGRPKQLTCLEEEILAEAIVQVLGKKKEFDFYSYHIEKEETEELYENYFRGYQKYLKDSKEIAEKHPEGAVLRTDVKSFYQNIIQDQLIDITIKELNIQSPRLEWLLTIIKKKELDNHENGKGLKQSMITSGFYANLYLKSIDDYFVNSIEWKNKIKFLRYVDDIIVIFTDKKDRDKLQNELETKLKQLNLELNDKKTEFYDYVSDFLPTVENDEELNRLNKNFQDVMSSFWIMNEDYRHKFQVANISHDHNLWWESIKIYQQCLYSLGIFVKEDKLSRKIYQKLQTSYIQRKKELILPFFPTHNNFQIIQKWNQEVNKNNNSWLSRKNLIKCEISNLLKNSFTKLKDIKNYLENTNKLSEKEKRQKNIEIRKCEMRIRFCVNKLLILGFDEVLSEIVELISEYFVIRNVLDVITGLAFQCHSEAINNLWEKINENPGNFKEEICQYISAVLIESWRFLPILNGEKWDLIFKYSLEAKSPIEKLKATETWLFLADIAKPFVKEEYLKKIVNSLINDDTLITRIKKNYLLILGIYNQKIPQDIHLKPLEKTDYMINNALKLAESGKISNMLKTIEPARVKNYYNTKNVPLTNDKLFSL